MEIYKRKSLQAIIRIQILQTNLTLTEKQIKYPFLAK